MKLYTSDEVHKLIKQFNDWCDKKGYPTCDLFIEDLHPLEVELLGQVKDGNYQIDTSGKIIS